MAGIVHATISQMSFSDGVRTGLNAAHATLLSTQSVNPDISQYLS